MEHRFTKILATVGPASSAPDTLRLLHDVGVNAFRLNFSHGAHEDHARSVEFIRQVAEEKDRPICIVADMQGPKLRVGPFKGGSTELKYGSTVTLKLGDEEGSGDIIMVPHPELFAALEKDHILKFDDGKLQVTVISNSGKEIKAKVDVPGKLSDRKGLNVIGAVLPMSAMTEKDREDMAFALSQDVDYIALSFVQTPQDVREAREIIGDRAGIIVKVEKPSAVEQLDDILVLADAVMVARGDLGVELPLEQVPIVQRRIIRKARALGKPVIVATHMLESMIDSPTPTRAEASDVATAVYLGTDAVMLSAETAVGRHPATAVAIMDRIIRAAETDPEFWDYFRNRRLDSDATAEGNVRRSLATRPAVQPCREYPGSALLARLSALRPIRVQPTAWR